VRSLKRSPIYTLRLIEMPFNKLIPTCACTKQNLRYKPKEPKSPELKCHADENERIVFLEIDDGSNPESCIRQYCNIEGPNEPLCDILIFYNVSTKKDGEIIHNKILCLVEIKGKDIKHSVEQIVNTYKAINSKFIDRSSDYYPFKWACHVLSKRIGSAPKNIKKYKMELIKSLHTRNCDISDKEDITPFIRCCVK